MRMVVAAGDTRSGDLPGRIAGGLTGPGVRSGRRPRGSYAGSWDQFSWAL